MQKYLRGDVLSFAKWRQRGLEATDPHDEIRGREQPLHSWKLHFAKAQEPASQPAKLVGEAGEPKGKFAPVWHLDVISKDI